MSCEYCKKVICLYDRPDNELTESAWLPHLTPRFCSQCGEPLTEPRALTLEELKAIKKPVPLYKTLIVDNTREYIGPKNEWWDVFCGLTSAGIYATWRSGHINLMKDYGKTWLAYDREPRKKGV